MSKRLVSLLASAAFVFVAASFLSSDSHATVELDRRYALESVGYLRAWDNMDGLFADYVSSAYKDYFSRQSRFVTQDLAQADALLAKSSVPYRKLIDDPAILSQIARSTRSETIIRTKVTKEGPQYRFVLEWLHAPEMEAISKETLVLGEPRDGKGFSAQELRAALELSLDKMIHHVPFIGSVTGRDNNSVTMNIGATTGVEKGDVLVIGTLEEVKHHPLLKEIVEWRFSKTGKVKIDQVEDRISFGKVVEEEPDQQIQRQQKVLEISRRPEPQTPVQNEKEKGENVLNETPSLGWVSGGLMIGGFSRDYTALDNSIGKNGSGFALGVSTDSQVWFTREWFGELGLGFAFWPYSQQDTLPGSSSTSSYIGGGSLLSFKLAGGYSYLLNGDLFGPKGWLKLGYRSHAYSLPSSTSDALTSISFKSLFVGLGADLPIRSEWGAMMDFGIGIVNSAGEDTQLSGSETSASDVTFSLGGYYRYMPRITFRATLDVLVDSADFSTGRNINQKVVTFTPAILYYF